MTLEVKFEETSETLEKKIEKSKCNQIAKIVFGSEETRVVRKTLQ